MAQNLSGLPNTDFLSLGRGAAYFALINSTTGYPDDSGYRHLGNGPSIELEIGTEDLDHFSSLTGVRNKDLTVALETTADVTLTLDELSDENKALFMLGSTAVYTNPHNATAITAGPITSNLKQGQWYQLYYLNGGVQQPIFDLQAAPAFTSGGSAVNAADYVLDLLNGRVMFKYGGASTSNGDTVTFTLSASGSANANIDLVRGLTASSGGLTGALQFVGINAVTGKTDMWFIHKIKLVPDGSLGLISDEFATLTLRGALQANTLVSSSSPYIDIYSNHDAV